MNWRELPPTDKQLDMLRHIKLWEKIRFKDITRGEAFDVIGAYSKSPRNLDVNNMVIKGTNVSYYEDPIVKDNSSYVVTVEDMLDTNDAIAESESTTWMP